MGSTGTAARSPMQRQWAVPLVLVGALVLSSCAGDQDGADDGDNPPGLGSDETAGAKDESADGPSNASGGGLIDVDGGYTQDEQMAELETVVDVMREHFGEDVATIDGQPWTAERHDAEIAPHPHGDDVYRHRVGFNGPADADLEETYAAAEEIAEELGLSENLNNSHGITEYGEIFYGAGREEGRTFVMTGDSTERFRASYQTRHSDDSSLDEAFERVVESNSEDRDPDDPLQMEDLEDVPGYEADDNGEPTD